jgi:hypothetical protein
VVDAIAAAERLYFGAGAFALIGRDYHGGLVLQIARLNAALASHGFNVLGARSTSASAHGAPTTLLLAAALASSARAVASVAQSRAAKRQADQPTPADITILISGLAALIAAASFTVARQAAEREHIPAMAKFAAVAGDLLKALTMKKPAAPQFLKLLGAAEDVLCRLDDAGGSTRPALAN